MSDHHKSRSRRGDWETSKEGAHDVYQRAPSQSLRLLRQYLDVEEGLTDDQAAQRADLNKPGICYWKRCGELRDDKLITHLVIMGHVVKRMGDAGSERMVCWITPEGEKLLQDKGLA